MAVFGASRRIIGLSSPVATTVTARARSRPSTSSMNSRTSRPRSPTSAMTVMSKPCERASMPSNVDLPMPEPAKMPMRCPAHSGENRSMTLTPVFTGVRTRWRRIGAGGSRSVETARAPCARGPPPSMGSPSALIVRPFQETCGLSVTKPRRHAVVPSPTLSVASNGLTVTPPASIRTTSPSCDRPSDSRSTHSPSRTNGARPRTRQNAGATSTTLPPTATLGWLATSDASAASMRASAFGGTSRAGLDRLLMCYPC